VRYPRAGILVPDFTTGSTLQMTGHAAIESHPARSEEASADELWVRFTAEEVIEIEDVLPQRLRLVEYSPFNPVANARLPVQQPRHDKIADSQKQGQITAH
jgi:hypothetical protein